MCGRRPVQTAETKVIRVLQLLDDTVLLLMLTWNTQHGDKGDIDIHHLSRAFTVVVAIDYAPGSVLPTIAASAPPL